MTADWPWPHFSRQEMACRCGCQHSSVEGAFMTRLEALREAYGKPMIVSSGYRCPAYNAAVSITGLDGPHTTGRAVDIQVYGHDAHRLLQLALGKGFTGIGLRQHGSLARRFVHLDDLTQTAGQPRPWAWSYT